MAKPEYQTTKVRVSTIKMLRQIYAITGERMIEIMDRLVKQELERLEKEQQGKKKDSEVKPRRRSQPFNSKPSASSIAQVNIEPAPSSL